MIYLYKDGMVHECDVALMHQIRVPDASLLALGIASDLVSAMFMERPWSVPRGKLTQVEAYYRPMEMHTQLYRYALGSRFYPVPYVALQADDTFTLVIASEEPDDALAVECVRQEIRRQLNYYWFFSKVKEDLLKSM